MPWFLLLERTLATLSGQLAATMIVGDSAVDEDVPMDEILKFHETSSESSESFEKFSISSYCQMSSLKFTSKMASLFSF